MPADTVTNSRAGLRGQNRDPDKRRVNVLLDVGLLEEAKQLGINLSKACEHGLALRIAEERAARWLEENKEAIASSNAYVETHGLPLARYRRSR